MKRRVSDSEYVCLLGVWTEDNPEFNYLEDAIKHSFNDDNTIVDWVVDEMRKSDVCKEYAYSVYDNEPPINMQSIESSDGRYTMYFDGNGTIEIWGDEYALSDSRKVSDGLEEGASPMFFFDCDLNLDWNTNYGGSRYYAPYNDLDYESFHDEKGKELPDVGFYTYEECYDAALKRAMDFYYEGVEKFADNPDVDVTGVHVQIIKLDENGDFGDYEDFFNIYPTEDNAETGKFIID